MDGLRVTVANEERIFTPGGDVAVVQAGQPVIKGRWRCPAGPEPRTNVLLYDLGGAPQAPLPVTYKFTQGNQLQVTAPGSVAFTYLGRIETDDFAHVTYQLCAPNGTDLGQSFVVYGRLSFKGSNRLAVTLEGGGATEIIGAQGPQSLKTEPNSIPGSTGRDRIRFVAVTTNTLTPGGAKRADAAISMSGGWQLTGTGAVFAKVENGVLKPDVSVAFAGTFKAVAAGFEFRATAGTVTAAFTVGGEHQWDSGTASWKFALGFNDTGGLSAAFKPTITTNLGPGTLNLSGSAKVTQAGNTVEFAVDIDAVYEWKNNRFVVSAQASAAGGALRYDLKIEGNFVLKNGALAFRLRFEDGQTTPQVEIRFQLSQQEILRNLGLVLNVSENQIDLSLNAEFEMRWVNGQQVRTTKVA